MSYGLDGRRTDSLKGVVSVTTIVIEDAIANFATNIGKVGEILCAFGFAKFAKEICDMVAD